MRIRGFRGASAVLAAACLAVAIIGCSGPFPEAGGPVSAPTISVTVTPTPTPTPIPEADTCDNAFTADLNSKMATDGLTFRDDDPRGDLDSLVGADGLRCEWTKPQTDLTVRYANWTRDLPAWDVLRGQLLADGYIETGPWSVSRPVPEFDSAYRYRNGVIHYASPARFIGWVTALQ